eukprot:CAMPEP_0180767996 /NCGR_PEP_ID=MMETSP1038_2-20121128/40322_1 /TAXON_ID=632150 /ORGANISM="Azadinium spinosum, Strain 3D9" /LENGTH=369 /DNA_ID=CAMNT_0022802603 /DNA_START=14 /DNA_END=1119 /DNA_ORIENTATION=+
MAGLQKGSSQSLAGTKVPFLMLSHVRRSVTLLWHVLQRKLGSETRLAPPDLAPFTISPFWPPLSDTGRPKPLLSIFLALLSALMYKLFYGHNASKLKMQLHERKRAMRLAQATTIIIDQQKHFHLTKELAAALRETDPDAPQIYDAIDNLVVRKPLRVPMNLDLTSFRAEPEHVLTAVKDGAALSEIDKVTTTLKGRTLTGIRRGESLIEVSTTHEVEEVFRDLTDEDYPLLFVLENVAPKTAILFNLVMDRAFNMRASQDLDYTEQERSRFTAVEEILYTSASKQLKRIHMRTLQARNMDGAEPVLAKDAKMLPLYKNGDLLRRELEFLEGRQKREGALYCLPSLVPQQALLEAKQTWSTIRRSQRVR